MSIAPFEAPSPVGPDRDSLAVTVVVAARNEEAFIEDCVHSLLKQTVPPGGFEIIVAEGASDDATRPILDRLAAEDDRLRVVSNPRQITPAAWNIAIRQARGRYVAIMGAHARYPVDYLVECLQLAERLHADNVGGPAIAEGDGYLQRSNAASHHSPFSVGGASWHSLEYEGKARTVFGGFYRRDVFDRVGMFDEELVRDSDAEFNFRLERAGGVIWQSPRVRSWYRPRATIGALFRQYRQYGYWKVRIMKKHGATPAVRQYVPAIFVAGVVGMLAATLVSAVAAGLWPGAAPVAVAVRDITLVCFATYAVVLVIASVTTAARYGWDLLPVLPVTFASYHVAYGLGFLNGLLDFVVRRRKEPRRSMSELTR
ncbi:MAG TPA: glycosyltransferase family 2 protein [Candidatus Dormibacteraeota bacterium]|nr:glycosyltransferase family 2 protein [Candidatus Dormibacteraeota bacterium]